MNLRNNQITVSEILQNPRAYALLQRELPMVFRNKLMLNMARSLTLQQAINRASGCTSKKQIDRLIVSLEQI